ncbi:hypothetical protein [Celeribacter indicus]|uniref:Carbohydrate-binding family V/XII n=1 Tax=Celeribacter indicus TaxID=1208324 RepID=A0A0B5E0K7_9RHOB|nr:hypothetical protein [Celeribacter indicus]AJE46002.1 carbohydrate-binding family V/XII [Celeribacter indicus]SDX32612.1 hypothetical protein SAMN05443573_1222 [Celeribacter indicus]
MLVCEPLGIDLDRVSVSLPEDDAPPWEAETSYGLGAQVLRGHRVFQSMVEDNLGIDPLTVDPTKLSADWLEVEYSNAYRCFDGVIARPTVADGALALSVRVTEEFDMFALFGVRAARLSLRLYDAADRLVGVRTAVLGGRVVSSWWDWFTVTPAPRRNKIAFDGLPVSARRADLTLEGGGIRLGEVFLGRSFYVGEAQPQSSGRAVTASRYEVNDFGRTIWVQRPTRSEMSYVVAADRAEFESIEPRMSELAGSLVVTVGAFAIPSTIHFGILGTIDWVEDSPDDYLFSFTTKGLS